MATLFKVGGDRENLEPQNGVDFSLKELQTAVDGYIETMTLPDTDLVAVMNEDAVFHNLPKNVEATNYIQQFFKYSIIPILGDVLIVKKSQIK